MRKVIAVIGEPGTGKTTLFREFMKGYAWENVEPVKLVSSMYSKELGLYVLGKYEEGEVFAGTDRLSMAVAPAAVEFVENSNDNILFEGDRLTSSKFFDFVLSDPNTELNIIILTVPKPIMEERYKERGSNQSETFLRGRKTKIDNIRSNFDYMDHITVFENKNKEDQKKILDKIKSLLLR